MLLKALSKRHILLFADHDVDLTKVGLHANDLVKHNLADKAGCAGDQNSFVAVKFTNAKSFIDLDRLVGERHSQ